MHPADDYRLAVRLQLEYDRHMQLVDRGRGFHEEPQPVPSPASHSTSARRLDFGAYAFDEYVFDDRPARAAGASSSSGSGALGRSASGPERKERRERKESSSRDTDDKERKPARKKADGLASGGSRTTKSSLKLQNPSEAVWERERITAPSRSGFSGLSSAMDRMMLSSTCGQDVDKLNRSISSSATTTGAWTDVRQTAYAYAPAPASSTYYQRRTEHYQVTSAEPEPVRPATASQAHRQTSLPARLSSAAAPAQPQLTERQRYEQEMAKYKALQLQRKIQIQQEARNRAQLLR